MTAPLIVRDPAALVAWAEETHRAGERIALVPTMGYLHEGHLSLVREARARAQRVVVSIFVNPTQFGPTEDLARYPSDFAGDLEKLGPLGVDVVFAPSRDALYPKDFDTFVVPNTLAAGL